VRSPSGLSLEGGAGARWEHPSRLAPLPPQGEGEGEAATNSEREASGARLTPPPRPRHRIRLDDRRFWIQAGVLLLVLLFCAYVARNVALNLDRLGVHTGFGFLARPAGFEIAQALIPYNEQSSYFRAFLVALLNTVLLSGVSIVLATILGFLIGLARLSSNRLLATVAGAYVEIVRNIPLLLQLLFWYFAVLRPLPGPRQSLSLFGLAFLNNRGLNIPWPVFGEGSWVVFASLFAGLALSLALAWAARRHRLRTGRLSTMRWLALLLPALLPVLAMAMTGASLSWSVPVLAGFNFVGGATVIPEFVAMTVGLSLYAAAFIAEIVRGGIRSVSPGQVDAARALGLRPWLVTSKVVVPLALRAIVPPLGGQYVLLLKNSSLAAAIAYPDLMLIFAGTALNQTGQPLEAMAITLATYLALGLAIATATGAWNRRLALVER
jgi:general L-amino acid transport system permease protein